MTITYVTAKDFNEGIAAFVKAGLMFEAESKGDDEFIITFTGGY